MGDHLKAMPTPDGATAVLLCRDGSIYWGRGCGASGIRVGELCFNTAMSGYQEIITDPSYDQQIVVFTFPHIGICGTNPFDAEAHEIRLSGVVMRNAPTGASNHRSTDDLDSWLVQRGVVAIQGMDTRQLTQALRDRGAVDAVIAHAPDGRFDWSAMADALLNFPGMGGADLVMQSDAVLSDDLVHPPTSSYDPLPADEKRYRVGLVETGAKYNIVRYLRALGSEVEIIPPSQIVTALSDPLLVGARYDALVLANGPGDPVATAAFGAAGSSEGTKAHREGWGPHMDALWAVLQTGLPMFGICLGHELLGLLLGCSVVKMEHGHHGANHPVLDVRQNTVGITSQNHGFTLDEASMPQTVRVTHRSLFDGTVAGIMSLQFPVLSVQYHPEAAPGPHDASGMFDELRVLMDQWRTSREGRAKTPLESS